MKKNYSYSDNIILFGERKITLKEKIVEVLGFEECIVLREKYSSTNPTNNVIAFDFRGDILWESDEVIKPVIPQTMVSIGKKDHQCVSIVSFAGLKFEVDVITGQVTNKIVTK